MVNVDSATGVPYPPSVIYEGPAITTTPGEPGRAAEVKWTLDPPVVLPKAGLYAFFIQNLCDGFFNLLADDRNSYSEGILWVTTRSDVSDCHLRVSPYAYPNLRTNSDGALPEGALVLVTLLPQEDESQFWMQASQASLAEVWDNPQDDIYAQLLKT